MGVYATICLLEPEGATLPDLGPVHNPAQIGGRGDYRLIVAFDFVRQIAFIKFLGAHAEYDAVDALTVSIF